MVKYTITILIVTLGAIGAKAQETYLLPSGRQQIVRTNQVIPLNKSNFYNVIESFGEDGGSLSRSNIMDGTDAQQFLTPELQLRMKTFQVIGDVDLNVPNVNWNIEPDYHVGTGFNDPRIPRTLSHSVIGSTRLSETLGLPTSRTSPTQESGSSLEEIIKNRPPYDLMVNGVPDVVTPIPRLNSGGRPSVTVINQTAFTGAMTFVQSAVRQDIGCYGTLSGHLGTGCNPTSRPDEVNSCAPFSANEFSEVVGIHTILPGDRPKDCTGTLIGDSWLITAAHCVTDRHEAADITVSDKQQTSANVFLKYVGSKYSFKFDRRGKRIIVHDSYKRELQQDEIRGFDLALIELESPFPAGTYDIALLASEVTSESTLVGYGFTERGEVVGDMNLGWPPPVQLAANGNLQITTSPSKTLFCFGDSGGPTFTGFNRGCDENSNIPEIRPRKLQGVISNFSAPEDRSTFLNECKSSLEMNIENITAKDIKDWICKSSDNASPSCLPDETGTLASRNVAVSCGGRSDADCFEYLGAKKIEVNGRL